MRVVSVEPVPGPIAIRPSCRRATSPLVLVGLAVVAGACREESSPRKRPADGAESAVATSGTALTDVPAPGQPTGCPTEMARIDGFCIDRWEAHLVRLDDAGLPNPHPHNQRPAKKQRYQARSAAEVFPQGYVSRDEASAACHQAGKRLCTFDEWRRACQGAAQRHHPYGTAFEDGRCNVGKEHLLRKLYGEDPSRWGYDSHFNNPSLNTKPGFLARTAQYARCVTEEGVYDLAGNLQEWVAATADYRFMRRLLRDHVEREDQPLEVGNGVFVGGFFSTLREHGPGCLYTTVAHEASYHDYSTGFRCCANPSG